jgi:hypothetical protein
MLQKYIMSKYDSCTQQDSKENNTARKVIKYKTETKIKHNIDIIRKKGLKLSKQSNSNTNKKCNYDATIDDEGDHIAADELEVNNLDETVDKNKTKFEKYMEELLLTKKKITDLQKQEKNIIKKINDTHTRELKKLMSHKRKPHNLEVTGFTIPKKVDGKLADWLRVDKGSMMSGPQISKIFWQRISEEGLQDKNDKRLFKTNKEVSAIFGVSMAVNKINDSSDKKGFNMRTYQSHIKFALENNNE